MQKHDVDEFMESTNIQNFRLDDTLLANAYEHAQIQNKAKAKSALALHFVVEEEYRSRYSIETKGAFVLEDEKLSRELSFFIIDETFNSPALFIAAIMPALFAKNTVGIIFKFEPSADILLCCEIMGLEHTFLVSDNAQIEKLLVEAKKSFVNFVCVILGEDDSLFNTLYLNAIRYTSYDYIPNILAQKDSTSFQIAYPNSPIYFDISEIPAEIEVDIVADSCNASDYLPYEFISIGEGLEWFTEILFPIDFFLINKRSYNFAE